MFFAMSIVLLVCIWVAASTNAPFSTVFLSFLPSFLTLLAVYVIVGHYGKKYLGFGFIVPLVWCGLFYVLALNGMKELQNVEVTNVLLLNLFISVIFIALLNALNKSIKVKK